MSDQLFTSETPSEVRDAKGLLLITQNIPNGQATQIILEELADTYDVQWTTFLIGISTKEQKKEWFLRLDPNGRIPVLVNKQQSPPFPVMETSPQLWYLIDTLDSEHKFGFINALEQSQALQWMFFWHGGEAPYQGQVNHFLRAAPEAIPCACQDALNRYSQETLRVYGVLELHLSGKITGEPREYLVGSDKGKYSVADNKAWPWVKNWARAGFSEGQMLEFPHLLRWINRIGERPAVQRGIGDKYAQKR
ncbi:glutathione S-transferase [Xylogone sp. PMI_703]|nr:glutathione S-transferase [Xylogone sp. PMI_703]